MAHDLYAILTEAEKRTALREQWFRGVYFTKVDLAGTVFSEAALEGGSFTLTDLYGADFCRANLCYATFLFV